MDADHSGSLDKEEVAALYKKARGEKLGKNSLKKAMQEMDSDHSGEVDVEEFEAWWATNGGDLEKHRNRAFTLVCKGGVELLLVAPDENDHLRVHPKRLVQLDPAAQGRGTSQARRARCPRRAQQWNRMSLPL